MAGQGLSVLSQVSCVTPPFPDRLLSLTLLAFEGLSTAAGKDQCLACIEDAFFPPLWAPLLALYRYRGPIAELRAAVMASPTTLLLIGLCTGPKRKPWLAAWNGTATPALPTWGCPLGSSPLRPAAWPMVLPSTSCASSPWRLVPAGSWTASVRGWCGHGLCAAVPWDGPECSALCCSASPAQHL